MATPTEPGKPAKATKPPKEPKPPIRLSDWRAGLHYRIKEDGGVSRALRSNPANVILILANDPAWAGVLVFDDFAEAIATRKLPPWRSHDTHAGVEIGQWSPTDTTRLQSWLSEHYALDVGPDVALSAVVVVADRVHVHPVRDWLLSLRWDGVRRLPSWLVDVFGAPDTALTRGIGTMWLVSAVARIFEPGCQVDTVLVLEGKPGLRKSSVLRKLFGDDWFFEMAVTDVSNKDAMQVLQSKWGAEFPEIDGLSRAEWSHVKAYFSRRFDRYRASYGHKAGDYPRQVVFAATTNKGQWIGDETGGTGRRMWPIPCERGTEDSVRLVEQLREQLWAEARARYESSERWHFTDPELIDAEREAQDDRYVQHPLEPLIAAWLVKPTDMGMRSRAEAGVTTTDVLTGLGFEAKDLTSVRAREAAAVLQHLGWVQGKQERRSGARVRLYRPPPATEARAEELASVAELHARRQAPVSEDESVPAGDWTAEVDAE